MRGEGKKLSGFTLIELLVVISIISLLSSVVFASVNSARAKARDAKRAADIKQVKLVLEFYYDQFNRYPPGTTDNLGENLSVLQGALANYLSRIPEDPLGGSWQLYQYVRGPVPDNSYGILVRRETGSFCKTGVNMSPGWWLPAPLSAGNLPCPF